MPRIFRLIICLLAAGLTACATVPSTQQRLDIANALASRAAWAEENINGGAFTLATWHAVPLKHSARLTVYIEGDGLAWLSPSTVSDDPTPLNPLALKLALSQPSGNAVYMARPCQYVPDSLSACPSRYWTQSRFAEEVIQASDHVLSQLKARAGATRLTIVGYSGGGAVAALLAARRNDVDKLITVAGNLDHQLWTDAKGLTPLSSSLNPATYSVQLSHVQQWHFVGSDDQVIPPAIAQQFAQRFPLAQRPRVIVLEGKDHHCCWEQDWPELWHKFAFDQ
ncbi:alpha/beta fold hydrolase [Aquitalea sp. ASV11]|uniref:alpha/beta fold hydrolase n=1 Tax=Aquitalea sp. ASV11 TaxID=2795103 RepID=UPI0018EADD03|nr:hypothetical protein [Aquitalea sp. ASV11]